MEKRNPTLMRSKFTPYQSNGLSSVCVSQFSANCIVTQSVFPLTHEKKKLKHVSLYCIEVALPAHHALFYHYLPSPHIHNVPMHVFHHVHAHQCKKRMNLKISVTVCTFCSGFFLFFFANIFIYLNKSFKIYCKPQGWLRHWTSDGHEVKSQHHQAASVGTGLVLCMESNIFIQNHCQIISVRIP